jgi:DNA polymerase (family 10)
MKLNLRKLVAVLRNISVLLEIKGENPFKSRAYANAANTIEEMGDEFLKEFENGNIGKIKGFGEALQKKVMEFAETGSLTFYEKLISEIPESLVEITKISTIGPKKAKLLYEKYGISNLDELEQACLDNRISQIKGFSLRSQEIILNSIHHKKSAKGKFLFDLIARDISQIKDFMAGSGVVDNLELTGGSRRFEETPRAIEFVAGTKNREKLIDV